MITTFISVCLIFLFMEKSNLPFAFDLFLNYPIAERLQPVIVLEQAIRNLGRIDSNN